MGDHEEKNCVQRAERIRQLNDQLRRRHEGGQVFITDGVGSLSVPTIARILFAIRDFDDFSKANDPYGEHDFGKVDVDGHEVFFKIDALDGNLEAGSPDPADETITCRVLTIMLASEY